MAQHDPYSRSSPPPVICCTVIFSHFNSSSSETQWQRHNWPACKKQSKHIVKTWELGYQAGTLLHMVYKHIQAIIFRRAAAKCMYVIKSRKLVATTGFVGRGRPFNPAMFLGGPSRCRPSCSFYRRPSPKNPSLWCCFHVCDAKFAKNIGMYGIFCSKPQKNVKTQPFSWRFVARKRMRN